MVVNWAVSEIYLPDAGLWGLPTAARDAASGVPRADQARVIGHGLIAYGRDDPEYVPGMPGDPGRGAVAVLDAAQQRAGYAQELNRGKRTSPGVSAASRPVAPQTGPLALVSWVA